MAGGEDATMRHRICFLDQEVMDLPSGRAALVCNKEGFRMPNKREKIVRQGEETKVEKRELIRKYFT
jgi:hypothetical protein